MTFFLVVVLLSLPFLYVGCVYVMPLTNALFAKIWEDPSDRQRKRVLRRLKELHVDNGMPVHSAILTASREFHVTEYRLLAVLGVADDGDIPALLCGRRDGIGGFLYAISQALKRRA